MCRQGGGGQGEWEIQRDGSRSGQDGAKEMVKTTQDKERRVAKEQQRFQQPRTPGDDQGEWRPGWETRWRDTDMDSQ